VLVIIGHVTLLVLFGVFFQGFLKPKLGAWYREQIKALIELWISLQHLLIFQTVKSKDAWNSPENSTDFPYSIFEIAHLDKTKQTFCCGIQASHSNDTAETELVAFFEQEQVL